MKINRNFDNLVPNYLLQDCCKKTNAYIAAHPDKKVIKLGIGDVTLPLAPVVVEAMKKVQRILLTRKPSRAIPIMRLRVPQTGYFRLLQELWCCSRR